MDNNKINPELKKMIESLQDVPERDLQAGHTGRENYMAQVKSLNPRRAISRKSARQGKPLGRRAWVTRFAAIAAVVVVALSSLGGTIYAAQAAQPNDLLYGVKTFSEQIQVRLVGDPENKLDLYVSFANRRLEEIQNQIAAGEQVSGKALELLEQHTRKMMEQAAMLDETGMNKALHQIEENLQEQNQTMAELGKEQPLGTDPRLEKALANIRERLELVKHGIKEPKGYREQMHSDQFQPQGDGKETGNPDAQGDPEGSQNNTVTPGSGSDGTGGK